MSAMTWWAKFIFKRLVVLGFFIFAAWYSISGNKSAPALPEPAFQLQKTNIDLYEQTTKNLTAEEKNTLNEIGLGKGAVTVEVVNPAANLTSAFQPVRQTAADAQNSYRKLLLYFTGHKGMFVGAVKPAFVALVALILGLRALKFWEPLRIISLLLLKASNLAIVLASVAALVMTFGFNVNIWRDSAFIVFWLPVGLLCAGAAGSWLVDDNFPVWRTLYVSMAFPLISGLGIMIKNLFSC